MIRRQYYRCYIIVGRSRSLLKVLFVSGMTSMTYNRIIFVNIYEGLCVDHNDNDLRIMTVKARFSISTPSVTIKARTRMQSSRMRTTHVGGHHQMLVLGE